MAATSRDQAIELQPVPADTIQGKSFPGRRTALAFLATFAIVLGVAYAVNYLGNADNLFAGGLNPSESDRAWKARQLRSLVKAGRVPEALILGSSRAMEIDPTHVEEITGYECFNFAVTGGKAVDCLSALQYAVNLGIKPRLIIMNIDEGMLWGSSIGAGQLRLAGDQELFRAVPQREQLEISQKIVQGINLESTWKNLLALSSRKRVSPTEGKAFLENGRRVEIRAFRQKQAGTFNLDAIIEKMRLSEKIGSAKSSGSQGQSEFNAHDVEYFLSVIEIARTFSSQVFVITTPEHPSFEDDNAGGSRRRLLGKLRELLASESEKRGFAYRDFSDLKSFEGDPAEFWDGTHQTPANMTRMVNVLFDREPDAPVRSLRTEQDMVSELERQLGLARDSNRPR